MRHVGFGNITPSMEAQKHEQKSIDIEMVLIKGDQGLGYTSLYNPYIVPTEYSITPCWFPLSFPFPYISQSLKPKSLKPDT